MHVVNSGTSHLNPITWNSYASYVIKYSMHNPPEVSLNRPQFKHMKSRKLFEIMIYLEYHLPAKIMNALASTINNKSLKKNSKQLSKLTERV